MFFGSVLINSIHPNISLNDDFIFYSTILNYSTTQTTHVLYPKPNLYLNAIYFREYCTYNKVCCIQHYQGVTILTEHMAASITIQMINR